MKTIIYDQAEISAIIEEIKQKLAAQKNAYSQFSYTKTNISKKAENKVAVSFTQTALSKLLMTIQAFDKEVAWHAVTERVNDNLFRVIDLLVYPQTVTATTVETDQDKYTQWLMELPETVFDAMRGQMHSHVNMSCSPSSVDLEHQQKIVNQLGEDDYYIFMIWNKRFEFDCRIFDMRTNTLYEKEDVFITCENESLIQYIEEAKKLVVEFTYVSSKRQAVAAAVKEKNESKKSDKKKSSRSETINSIYRKYYYNGAYDEYDKNEDEHFIQQAMPF